MELTIYPYLPVTSCYWMTFTFNRSKDLVVPTLSSCSQILTRIYNTLYHSEYRLWYMIQKYSFFEKIRTTRAYVHYANLTQMEARIK
jgi:hypothetical protein